MDRGYTLKNNHYTITFYRYKKIGFFWGGVRSGYINVKMKHMS